MKNFFVEYCANGAIKNEVGALLVDEVDHALFMASYADTGSHLQDAQS